MMKQISKKAFNHIMGVILALIIGQWFDASKPKTATDIDVFAFTIATIVLLQFCVGLLNLNIEDEQNLQKK